MFLGLFYSPRDYCDRTVEYTVLIVEILLYLNPQYDRISLRIRIASLTELVSIEIFLEKETS